ncbi:Rv0909 family putative TA system antitoxin [Amycolatopsis sp. CA-230715]|uniref:Rv0909 family putative TA system antitoxin n=1 Tax=Amycolatopsis sp. CA-230715 TaxID=2745196 RepID=UPI001C039F96|nr:Rv0909 family putative TA system antitoxin [Amycolatopsis sp. CA-230715]QWF81895.1 hypothetical protein HUW46_05329 [Amycolatopsis sp. CA-230715]
MSLFDKAKDLATEAAGKALTVGGEVASKAGDVAATGITVAAAGADKVTGGKFTDQITGVSETVEGLIPLRDRKS